MSDKRKEQQEEAQTQSAANSCAEMMQKMIGQQGKGSSCGEMMSQMMASCCGSQEETEADAQQA